MKNNIVIAEVPLAHTKEGKITVAHISEPYGEGSKPVVSIGVALDGDESKPDWKVHIPYENINDIIAALKAAKEKFKGE
jgi:hypothetical protein